MIIAPVIPDNAPFNPEQRAWLNGFFAGLFADDAAPISAATLSARQPSSAEEDFPWHDPALTLDERLKLSEGRPLPRRLMAAMAQLDCGQCGYLCQTYGEAIAEGKEEDLGRCVPGARATQRKLKELLAGAVKPAPVAAATKASATIAVEQAPAVFTASVRLTDPTSDKDTRQVVLQLNGSGLTYEVGDSLGVHATNCPDLVATIVNRLGADPHAAVEVPDECACTVAHALTQVCDIVSISDDAISVLARHAVSAAEADRLESIAAGANDVEEGTDLLDFLTLFPSSRPPVAELIAALARLRPRLYSISSSLKVHPGEVHLTVAPVRYQKDGRARKGVASTFLADRAICNAEVPVFVQKSHGFRLPEDPSSPVVMVGPGTGVAPFRAFLEERRAIGANGRNWLFFGERRSACDFLYRSEFEEYRRDGFLTRFDAAFSRDQAEKIYVQNRMTESGAELWSWLQDGAYFYVCGDAKKMARDVDQTLHAIVAHHGAMSAEKAKGFVADLARAQRYQRDVY